MTEILGPITLATVTNNTAFGDVSWTSPENAGAEDASCAEFNFSGHAGIPVQFISNYLRAVGGDFSALPDGATIVGITPRVKRKAHSDSGSAHYTQVCHDQRARIVKRGTILSTDLASADEWPAALTWKYYAGGLWGTTWTPADIKATGFGLALSVFGESNLPSEMWEKAFVDAFDIAIEYVVFGGDWTWTGANDVLTVSAADITPPDGHTITGYQWNWGDGTSSATANTTAQHRYAAGGTYTVTLTVSISGAISADFQKEITMATITTVSPLMATRGASGTLITITGTGFGATQTTGTITIGAVAPTVVSWNDTTITCRADDDPVTPLGSQSIVVTPASGSAVTKQNGIYIYVDTDNKDADDVALGIVDEVFLNGAQVGFTHEALDMTFRTREIEFEPADRFDTVQTWTYTGPTEVKVTFSQIDGALLATMLGGTYDAVNKIVTVAGNSQYSEASLAIQEASGVTHVFKRVKVTGDVTLSLNKEVKALPVTFRVLSLDDPSAKKYECSFP